MIENHSSKSFGDSLGSGRRLQERNDHLSSEINEEDDEDDDEGDEELDEEEIEINNYIKRNSNREKHIVNPYEDDETNESNEFDLKKEGAYGSGKKRISNYINEIETINNAKTNGEMVVLNEDFEPTVKRLRTASETSVGTKTQSLNLTQKSNHDLKVNELRR